MRWTGLLAFLFTATLPSLALARSATVITSDGFRYEGETFIDTVGMVNVVPIGHNMVRVNLTGVRQITFATSNASANNTNGFRPQIILRRGSIISGTITNADDTAVRITVGKRIISVPTASVATLLFQPLIGDLARKFEPARKGALLRTGDFLDGDFRSVEGGRVALNSVLFGTRTFDISSLAAVNLRTVDAPPTAFEVRSVEGSLFLTDVIRATPEQIQLQDPSFGTVQLPMTDVQQITHKRR